MGGSRGTDGIENRFDLVVSHLGKHTMGKGCLYIKRLSDVDLPTLKKLINGAGKKKK